MTLAVTLTTPRLVLRPFVPEDAAAVQRFVSDRAVAGMTSTIPHPYPEGAAAAWIRSVGESIARGDALVLALTTPADGLVGAAGLHVDAVHAKAELGYWIGRPHWNRGFATEAAAALVAHGFRALRLERIHARFMVRNPASGRVLAKLGFQREGLLRRDLYRFGEFIDCELWADLRDDFLARAAAQP